RIKGNSNPGKAQLSWSELSDLFPSQITRFTEEFKSGLLTVDPVDPSTSCRYCGLHGLCRIRELNEADAAHSANTSDGELYE
ncbi:MAG: hypothetical protein VXY78_07270, partial [Pseudomonadota bacterium]|nr:hypothetical protein [Pseudomonadota bacterium]